MYSPLDPILILHLAIFCTSHRFWFASPTKTTCLVVTSVSQATFEEASNAKKLSMSASDI